MVLTWVAHFGWDLRQLDLNNAFLNSDLEDTIYMVESLGFVESYHPNYMFKLKKSLYGFKWFQVGSTCLVS